MEKMKTLASEFVTRLPRSRTHTRLNVLTYDNIIDWKGTRDLSQAKLSEAIKGLDLRKSRSDTSLVLFTKTIDQAYSDNFRPDVDSVVIVISDEAPNEEILSYLNGLARKEIKVVMVIMNGGVKDLGDVVIHPGVNIITGGGEDGDIDVDEIDEAIKPGKRS